MRQFDVGRFPAHPRAGFRQGEVSINRVLLAIHAQPTAKFLYDEAPCGETDTAHGNVNIDYVVPGTLTATQATAELKSVGIAMHQLGYGTPTYETEPDGVYVTFGPYSLLFSVNDAGADSGSPGFAFQTCYATPAPTGSPGSYTAGLQPLTASPAPTSLVAPTGG